MMNPPSHMNSLGNSIEIHKVKEKEGSGSLEGRKAVVKGRNKPYVLEGNRQGTESLFGRAEISVRGKVRSVLISKTRKKKQGPEPRERL